MVYRKWGNPYLIILLNKLLYTVTRDMVVNIIELIRFYIVIIIVYLLKNR